MKPKKFQTVQFKKKLPQKLLRINNANYRLS